MRAIIMSTLLLVLCVLPYKPQNPVYNPNDKSLEKNIGIKKETIVKKTDSIQNVIDKTIQKAENNTQLNNKLKEDNLKLQKLENQITTELINELIKERKDLVYSNQKTYIPKESFKELAVEYKGEVYYVVKDSVCISHERKNFLSKRTCKKYDYFLKITK